MKIKKTIFKILIFSFILSVGMALPASADSDFSGKDNSKTLELLYCLGVMNENDNIELSQNVTREQLAMYVTRIMNIDESIYSSDKDTSFSDVGSDNTYKNYIECAVAFGIMSEYSDGKFYPDKEVSYQECMKVMADLLGYADIAEASGGYPDGYFAVIKNIKLSLNGIHNSDSLTTEQLAILINDALDTDIMKTTSSGVEIQHDHTMLNEYFDVYKDDGIINAISNSALDGDIELGENECLIDKYIYDMGKTNAEKYMGYNVDYYYKDKTGDSNTLVCIIPRNYNNTIYINKYDLTDSTTYKAITYFDENNKEKTAKIDTNAYVMYNGRALSPKDRTLDILNMSVGADTQPIEGEITLIDNDGDGQYEVIDIRAGHEVVVDHIDILNSTIYDKLNPQKTVDAKDDVRFDKLIITKDDASITLAQINEWDILIVEDSFYDNNKIRTIKVSSSSISGTVNGTGGSNKDISIGDKLYSLSDSYLFADNNNLQTFGKVDTVGTEGVFYLDIYGKIVACNIGPGMGGYGYLINYYPPDGSDEAGPLEYKILNTDGKIERLSGVEKIKIVTQDSDGTQIKKRYKGFDKVKGVLPTGQIIKFQTDEEGCITEITVPTFFNGKAGYDYSAMVKAKNNGAVVATEKASYNYTDDCVQTFESKLYVDSRTKILLVSGEMKDDNDFSWLSIGYITNAKSYTIEAYDIDEFMHAPLIVLYMDNTQSNIDGTVSMSDFMVVSNVYQTIDDDGQAMIQITGVQEGQEKKLSTKETSKLYDLRPNKMAADKNNPIDFENLKCGDVIQYYESGYNKIGEALRIFKDEDKLTYVNATSPNHQEKVLLYCEVVKIDRSNKLVVVNINPPQSDEQNLCVLDLKYTSFSFREDDLVKAASFEDIQVGDYLFIRDQWSRIHNTAIMRFEK